MTATAPRGRLPAVDVARGAALVAMFGYHLTWDFAHFGLIDAHAPFSPQMRFASHAIASSFLFIAGLSLALARRAPFDWRGYWKRFAIVAGAAALVTAASFALFPDAPILFGILHCIAAASLLALPFLFLPWPAALAAAAVVAILPFAIALPAFDGPALAWTGLGTIMPTSNDFRPLTPWAAPLLGGLAFGLSPAGRAMFERLAGFRARAAAMRALAFGGRHSLAVYLLHQPIFFAVLTAAVWAIGPGAPAPDEAPFRAACERRCLSSGAAPDLCVRACACTAREMRQLGLWTKLVENRLDSAETTILSRIAQACVTGATPKRAP